MRIVNTDEIDSWLLEVEERRRASSSDAENAARAIIEDVRTGGDTAAASLVAKFDGIALAPGELRIPVLIGDHVDDALTLAIDEAAERIEAFHAPQKLASYELANGGSVMRQRVAPLRRVAVYVPGGRAVYVSTLLMCAIPARLAGVREIVAITTPRVAELPEFRYACAVAGVTEIYRAGGAAGIAAAAYGTESLRRVDKIVGPGNSYVAAAKQIVSSVVGIDMIAGPTEVVVLADENADMTLVAADLLAQAEHGTDSTPICIVPAPELAIEVRNEVARQLDAITRPTAARESIQRNGAVVIADRAMAIVVVNRIAPEHVEILASDPMSWADQIENCGAIFCGPASPVAIGDYVAGPNHVLPTAGTGRFASPLGVYDFVKRSNVIALAEPMLREIAGAGEALAQFEGLPLHARSIAARNANGPVEGGLSSPSDRADNAGRTSTRVELAPPGSTR